MEFAKIWPLTCHNWVKYWPRTKNNTTNREYSARAICWSFLRSSTTLRLETPRGVAPTPPPTPAKVANHRLRARVKSRDLLCACTVDIWLYLQYYWADLAQTCSLGSLAMSRILRLRLIHAMHALTTMDFKPSVSILFGHYSLPGPRILTKLQRTKFEKTT